MVFQATAALFLLFALPCFFLVREPPKLDAQPLGWAALRGAVERLASLLAGSASIPV